MKVKTTELTGIALDWAVAQIEGVEVVHLKNSDRVLNSLHYVSIVEAREAGESQFRPSGYWSQGGVIISREGTSVIKVEDELVTDRYGKQTYETRWVAALGSNQAISSNEVFGEHEPMYQIAADDPVRGQTPLIAAMRRHVMNKLGPVVDVPNAMVV